MTELVELIKALIEDPILALLLISWGATVVAFIKGWAVPRFIFDREVVRADKADVANLKTADAIEALTLELRQRREVARR